MTTNKPESRCKLDRRHTVIDFVAKIVEKAYNSNPAKVDRNCKRIYKEIGIKSKAVLLEHSIAQSISVYVAIQNRLAMDES